MPRGTRNAQVARLDGLRRIIKDHPMGDWEPLYEAWLRGSGLPMVEKGQRYRDIAKARSELRAADIDMESFAWGLASDVRDIFHENKRDGPRGANGAALNAFDRLDRLFDLRAAIEESRAEHGEGFGEGEWKYGNDQE